MSGTLYLVGTPIGNLEDMTLRAARVLSEVDLVAAEDTRRTVHLLSHLGISKSIVSYHEHNRRTAGPKLLEALQQGKNVALVSDAGMPVVSDPGSDLVREAAALGIAVTVIPGPCAVSSALALSGMDGARYAFEGFLPREGKARRMALQALHSEQRPLVFYEAPHRLRRTLQDLLDTLGDRDAALCNDITKFYERVDRAKLSQLLAQTAEREPRGEYAFVVAPAEEASAEEEPNNSGDAVAKAAALVAAGMSRSEAAKRTAKETGVSRNELYQALLRRDGEGEPQD
jgi:16S rRNA (cytidine1402-2'-O)-methyltransferase